MTQQQSLSSPSTPSTDEELDKVVQQLKKSHSIKENVTIDIHYEIIEHFSKNLYSSPHKAIEELVINGFDAMATEVYVWIPGSNTNNSIVVWDNGTSMDTNGLKELWKIANSPKRGTTRQIAATSNANARKIIGKFGIGKLASYTVGSKISHLCKQDNHFYFIEIDYDTVIAASKSNTADNTTPFQEGIYPLNETDAKDLLKTIFNVSTPSNFEQIFSEETWTVAIINSLKEDIKEGRLRWILGNGMPLRPDFEITLNNERVASKYERTETHEEWHIGDTKTQKALNNSFKDQDLEYGTSKNLDPKDPNSEIHFVELPNLGKVWGTAKLYKQSLKGSRADEQGRSHGFFLFIRGRLVNIADDKILISDPNYGTFYRSQYIINADQLDSELLANRSEFKETSPMAEDLKKLQDALISLTRLSYSSRLSSSEEESNLTLAYRIPTNSRELYLEPMAALLEAVPQQNLVNDQRDVDVKIAALGEEELWASVDSHGSFQINSDHPYYIELQKSLGTGKKGKQAMSEFHAIAVSDLLLKGHLLDLEIEPSKIEQIFKWKDQILRRMSRTKPYSFPTIKQNLYKTSEIGGEAFEKAIASAFLAMGFSASQDGKSGVKDGLIIFPTETEKQKKVVFEAKGKNKGALANDDAEVSGAASHREIAQADHAVIIAREFAGFVRSEEPAILKECLSTGGVSIMELDALVALLEAIDRFAYSIDNSLIYEIITTIETPEEKLKRIREIENPAKSFPTKRILELTWKTQNEHGKGRPVAIRSLFYQIEDSEEIDMATQSEQGISTLTLLFEALQVMSGRNSIKLTGTTEKSVLLQKSPDAIIAALSL